MKRKKSNLINCFDSTYGTAEPVDSVAARVLGDKEKSKKGYVQREPSAKALTGKKAQRRTQKALDRAKWESENSKK